jgi:hypothetical protein
MGDLIARVAEHGILGLGLAIAIWALWKRDQAFIASQNARLADANAYRERQEQLSKENASEVKRLTEACTTAITAQTHVTESYRTSLGELHETFKEYVDEARRPNTRR